MKPKPGFLTVYRNNRFEHIPLELVPADGIADDPHPAKGTPEYAAAVTAQKDATP